MEPDAGQIPVLRWDSSIPYAETARLQEERVAQQQECIVLCEHPDTITLGTSAIPEDLLLTRTEYDRLGIDVYDSPRGGKATYHGSGQLVVYPILNLRARDITIHGYLRLLEQCMIAVCACFGIHAQIIPGKTGVWVEDRKIGFIGVRVRRGFSFHGVSLNITPQHEAFRRIVPCGMPDLQVTSIQEESATPVPDLWSIGDILYEEITKRLMEYQTCQQSA